MMNAGWITAATIEEITDGQIQKFIRERAVVNKDEKKDLPITGRAVRDVQINMEISDPESRIWTLKMH